MISIVIPVYNNERQLVELNNRIDKALEDMPYELVLIDDASTDDSLNLIKSLKEKNDAIQIIINENNIGQQLTTLTGIKSAIGSSIVVLDADLQDDPDLIPSLVSYLLNDSTAAFIRRKGIYQSMSRMFTSTIIKMIIYMISGLHYKAGAYYAFPVKHRQDVIRLAEKCRYPYMTILVARSVDKLVYLEAKRHKRMGSSSYSFIKRIRAAARALHCAIQSRRIKLEAD